MAKIPKAPYTYANLSLAQEDANLNAGDIFNTQIMGKKVTRRVAYVERIIDGDTFVAEGVHFRIFGVNTAETAKGFYPTKPGQPGGIAATEFLKKTILGKKVILEIDLDDTSGAYGRTLARVYLPDGRDLTEMIISAGHSEIYDYKKISEQRKIQRDINATIEVGKFVKEQAALKPEDRQRPPGEIEGFWDTLGYVTVWKPQAEMINFMQYLKTGQWGSASAKDRKHAGDIFEKFYRLTTDKTIEWLNNKGLPGTLIQNFQAFQLNLGGGIAGDWTNTISLGSAGLVKKISIGGKRYLLNPDGIKELQRLTKTRGTFEGEKILAEIIEESPASAKKWLYDSGIRFVYTSKPIIPYSIVTKPLGQAWSATKARAEVPGLLSLPAKAATKAADIWGEAFTPFYQLKKTQAGDWYAREYKKYVRELKFDKSEAIKVFRYIDSNLNRLKKTDPQEAVTRTKQILTDNLEILKGHNVNIQSVKRIRELINSFDGTNLREIEGSVLSAITSKNTEEFFKTVSQLVHASESYALKTGEIFLGTKSAQVPLEIALHFQRIIRGIDKLSPEIKSLKYQEALIRAKAAILSSPNALKREIEIQLKNMAKSREFLMKNAERGFDKTAANARIKALKRISTTLDKLKFADDRFPLYSQKLKNLIDQTDFISESEEFRTKLVRETYQEKLIAYRAKYTKQFEADSEMALKDLIKDEEELEESVQFVQKIKTESQEEWLDRMSVRLEELEQYIRVRQGMFKKGKLTNDQWNDLINARLELYNLHYNIEKWGIIQSELKLQKLEYELQISKDTAKSKEITKKIIKISNIFDNLLESPVNALNAAETAEKGDLKKQAELYKIADEIKENIRLKQIPGTLEKTANTILKNYGAFNALWRKSVTLPFTAYHSVNLMGARLWQNYLAHNLIGNTKNVNLALKGSSDPLWRTIGHLKEKAGLGKLTVETDRIILVTDFDEVWSASRFREFLERKGVVGQPGIVDTMRKDDEAQQGLGKVWTPLIAWAESIENQVRSDVAYQALKKGATEDEAADLAFKYHFDYSGLQLTAFESGLSKYVIAFYSWQRFNIPLQAANVLSQPGRYSIPLKIAGALGGSEYEVEREYFPDYLKGAMVFRSPMEEGTYYRIRGPWEDISMMGQKLSGENFMWYWDEALKDPRKIKYIARYQLGAAWVAERGVKIAVANGTVIITDVTGEKQIIASFNPEKKTIVFEYNGTIIKEYQAKLENGKVAVYEQFQPVQKVTSSLLYPIIRIPIEVALGKELFTGKPITNYQTYLLKALAGRYVSFANIYSDPTLPWSEKFLELGLGIQVIRMRDFIYLPKKYKSEVLKVATRKLGNGTYQGCGW